MTRISWRFGIIAGIFVAVFALYTQMKLVYNRGGEWQANYAYNDIDEVAYASFLRALIDGRPRKNDPYTGRDDSAETPQLESLFSIQFAAPYAVAIPARILGIDAPWAMTLAAAFRFAIPGANKEASKKRMVPVQILNREFSFLTRFYRKLICLLLKDRLITRRSPMDRLDTVI